ncbi:MAG: hypothetical protein NC393_01735 [Clostridium sp.]|nr:hypothetical protein [Clostridium sp.]MCM1170825.1 hypothetical protein [Clostridium sp.]MCM1208444.1 hypothetical protein [Ruminococcus sp.]
MDKNVTTQVNYEVLDTEISNLASLKEESETAVKNKYNEIKSVFAASDSLTAEQFYATADLLYSVDAIMNDMINQTIITMQYVKAVFRDMDETIANALGG